MGVSTVRRDLEVTGALGRGLDFSQCLDRLNYHAHVEKTATVLVTAGATTLVDVIKEDIVYRPGSHQRNNSAENNSKLSR